MKNKKHISADVKTIRGSDIENLSKTGLERTASKQAFSIVPTVKNVGKIIIESLNALLHKYDLFIELRGLLMYISFRSASTLHIGIPQGCKVFPVKQTGPSLLLYGFLQ